MEFVNVCSKKSGITSISVIVGFYEDSVIQYIFLETHIIVRELRSANIINS